MKLMYFSIKYRYSNSLLKTHKLHLLFLVLLLSHLLCVGMVSLTSASRYATSVSRFQSRSSMYIRGLIPRISTELAKAVPIGGKISYHTYQRENNKGAYQTSWIGWLVCTFSSYNSPIVS